MRKTVKQESQTIEFKAVWDDEYLKWICSYANTNGGILHIGVNDDGFVMGVEDSKKLLESIPNKIHDRLGITVSAQIHEVAGAKNILYGENVPEEISDKLVNQYVRGIISSKDLDANDPRYEKLLAIEEKNKIWENNDGIRQFLSIKVEQYSYGVSYKGVFYKRSGSTVHDLNGAELQQFLLDKAGITWDEMPVRNVKIEDLSKEALEVFRSKAVKNGRMTIEQAKVSDELLLKNLKLMNGNNLTRAAVILFHPDPRQYISGTFIKIGYFSPSTSFDDDGKPFINLRYQDIVEGPLILQTDKALDLIFTKYMKGLITVKGLYRIDQYMFTREILREILLNAANHKDYSHHAPTQIRVYEDHIEVVNEGSWPEELPINDELFEVHRSIPHNPRIAEVSFMTGETDDWGRGFALLKEKCKEIHAPLPIIQAPAVGGGIMVTQYACEEYMRLLNEGNIKENKSKNKQRKAEILKSPVSTLTDEKYTKLMEYLSEPRTRQEIQDFCGIKTREYLRRYILNPLVKLNVIDMINSEKPKSPNQKYIVH